MQRWINEVPNEGLIHYHYFFNAERLLLTSPKALGEVLVQRSYEFIKPNNLRAGLGRILGVGVLLAEGEEHKVRCLLSVEAMWLMKEQIQRKNLQPAFAYRHIRNLYPVFWSKSREMVLAMTKSIERENSGPIEDVKYAPAVEVGGWTSRAALDIIGVAGMGQDFNAIQDPDTELSATYRKIFQPTRQAQIMGLLGSFVPMWFLRALPIQRNEDIEAAANTIRKVCRQLIRQKQLKLDNKEKTTDVDILSVAIGSGGFTEENLIDQLMTFLAAGHETTATSMVWAIHALCKNLEYQTRLRKEIRANLPSIDDDSTPVTDTVLERLPFLHAVCNEVLRVHSPVPLTIREAANDTTILSQHVPKGTRIILSPWAVNLSTELWGPDAAKFNPDRWMSPGRANTGGAENAYSFMTFLHGPRSCIGQSFAKAEFACLLASIVGRFEMVLEDPDMVIEIKGGITARPKGGLPVRLRKVEGW